MRNDTILNDHIKGLLGKLIFMEGYDLSKLDIFEMKNLKRMELCRIHSVLLFLYSKLHLDTKVAFKYSELECMMNYNLAHDTLAKLNDMGLIDIVQEPNKKRPVVVELKSNAEIQEMLNKDKRVEFEKFNDKTNLNVIDFKEAIGCKHLYVHFDTSQIDSWMKNINKGIWDRYKFLATAKIVTYFNSSADIKTGTLNKRNSKNNNKDIKTTISEIYDRVPRTRQEIIYKQFQNTVKYHNIRTDGTLPNMVAGYLHKLGYKDYL